MALYASSACASNWVGQAQRAVDSVVYIRGVQGDDTYVCSGFVIDDKRGLVMTAEHCVKPELSVDDVPSYVVFEDEKDDVAVLQTITDKPALRPELKPVVAGEEVISIGYGYGFPVPQTRVLHVAAEQVYVPDLKDYFIMYDTPIVGGMSGGPVVDSNGRVVSINQLSDELSALDRTMDRLYKATSKFWRK